MKKKKFIKEKQMCIKFEGRLFKSGKYWPVTVPSLGVTTQGKSKKDAYFMIKDAIELLIYRRGFKVNVIPLNDDRFVLFANSKTNDKYLVAMMLKNQRFNAGLTIQQVADRLGVTKHAYAQYEQARALPSLTKIEEFLRAMNKKAHVVLEILEEAA
jgi:DNA-binding XRE family transcriptional regulator/predicted RNase H-like HicB family nuclease